MSLIRVNLQPSPSQLAVFGGIWLVFFSGLAAIVYQRGGAPVVVQTIAAAAIIVPAVGWIVPAFMRIVYIGMSLVTLPIGLVVSHLLLAAIYYLLLTPVGLLMRLCGYDPMHRRFQRDAPSYWIRREGESSVDRYFRQM